MGEKYFFNLDGVFWYRDMKQITLFFRKTTLPPNALAAKLQGFLMKQLSADYADFLHEQETNPYALYVVDQESYQVWVLNLLTEEACEQMQNIVLTLETITLETYPDVIPIEKIEVKSLSAHQLLDMFNSDCEQQVFSIKFLTPTSFKTAGDYAIFPTTRLIFQSLMQKYSRLFPEINTFDSDLLDYLIEHSKITSYQLQTYYFSVHKKKIPAFRGRVTIKMNGASSLRAFVKMLLTFGEFSGVGIKTSMGMGGIGIEERKD